MGNDWQKLKWIGVVAACLGMLLMMPVAASASEGNLLPNAGFEVDSNSDSVPDQWTKVVYQGTPVVEMDTSEHYEGSASVRMTGTVANQDRATVLYQIADASELNGNGYNFSIFQKTSAIVSGEYGSVVRISFLDADNQNVKPQMFVAGLKGTNDWSKLEVSFIVPHGTDKINIEPFLWRASGSVWWDEVQFTPDDMLPNSGFEIDANVDGTPDGWQKVTYSGSPVFNLDTTEYMEDAQSQKISGSSTGDRASIAQSWDVSSLSYDTITFSTYVKTQNIVTSNPAGFGTSVRISYLDASNQLVIPAVSISGVNGTTDWSKLERRLTIPEGTITMRIELFLYLASGTVWWDDVSVQPYSSGLISDFGLENDSDLNGIPFAWGTSVFAGDPTFDLDGTVKYKDSYSYKMTGDSAEDRGALYQDIYIPTLSPFMYKFSAWVKTTDLISSSHGSVAKVEFYDGNNDFIEDKYITGPKGTVDWTKMEQVFFAPEGTERIRVFIFLWQASGAVWWDQVNVTPVDLILNKSFESDTDNNNLPDDWSKVTNGGNPLVTLVSDTAYDGDKAVKMTGSDLSDQGNISQTVILPDVNAPWGYKVSINHKVQNIVSKEFGTMLRVRFKDDNGSDTGSAVIIRGEKGTKDWTKLEQIVVPPYGTTKLIIEAYLWKSTGTVWWDQADITTVGLLANKDFELDGDSNELPDDWTFQIDSGSPSISMDTDEVYYDGVYNFTNISTKITGASTGDQAALSQIVPLSDEFESGGTFSVMYKTDNLTSASHGASVRLTFLDGSNAQVGLPIYVQGGKGTRNWSKLSRGFIPPDGSEKMKVELLFWLASGTVWWDFADLRPGTVVTDSPIIGNYGVIIQQGRPSFFWSNRDNAAKYTLQYSQDPSFLDGTTVTVSDLISTSHQPTVQLAEGTWYSRARVVDSSNTLQPYGPVNKFFVQRLVALTDEITPNSDGAKEKAGFTYVLQDTATVTLQIWDGSETNLVRDLVSSESQMTGTYEVVWDGKDDVDSLVVDGTYMAKLLLEYPSSVSVQSEVSITVNAADTSGYRGIENNKDWSDFYKDLLENTARNTINDQDPVTGRFTRIDEGSGVEVPNTSAYAFIMAEAYTNPSSSYYGNTTVRDKAIAAFNYALSREVGTTGSWTREIGGDPNMDRFSLAPLAETYMLIHQELDTTTKAEWESLLLRAANYQIDTYGSGPDGGVYPNQDANYVLVIGLVGSILNDNNLLDEANRVLLLMYDDMLDNGGFYYYVATNPVPNYQHINLTFLARYYEVTGDTDAISLIEQAVPYYPQVFEVNGAVEYGSSPEMKQIWPLIELPGGADTVAYFTEDGQNKMVANILKEKYTKVFPEGYTSTLQAYNIATGRGMTSSVVPVKLNAEGIIKDTDIDGFRGRWGDFSVSLTPAKSSTTLASAMIIDKDNPIRPVNSALNINYFESKKGSANGDRPRDWAYLMPPGNSSGGDPTYQTGIVADKLYEAGIAVQHVSYIPTRYYSWRYAGIGDGDWKSQQTWIMVDSRLIGMHTMRAIATGEGEFAGSRMVFGPAFGSGLQTSIASNELYGSHNRMGFWQVKESNADWEYDVVSKSLEPGTQNAFNAPAQPVLRKKEELTGGISYTAGDKISYQMVLFPLDLYETAEDWIISSDNNIEFGSPAAQVLSVQISVGNETDYVVIANHGSSSNSSNYNVALADGNYMLTRYDDDSGTPAYTASISVSGGLYALSYALSADSVSIYKFVAQ